MIKVANLVKRIQGVELLKGITFEVAAGEVAVIIGPSGGGKTTLLRCLNGLEPWDEGSVSVADLRVNASTLVHERRARFQQIRRSVGMVLQDFQLFPHRTVLRNVTEAPRHVLGIDRAQAEATACRLLDRVGMLSKINAQPSSLSGGQQQRVAIARALAMEPRVILFDEPTSALDSSMTNEVLTLLRDLVADGLTLVIVTHTLAIARQIASTVHVVADGLIVESAPPAQIFDQPAHPITQQLFLTTT